MDALSIPKLFVKGIRQEIPDRVDVRQYLKLLCRDLHNATALSFTDSFYNPGLCSYLCIIFSKHAVNVIVTIDRNHFALSDCTLFYETTPLKDLV